jgi:anti-anti-sigma factor
MAFEATVEVAGDVARVYLKGELNAATAGQFQEKIAQLADQKPKRLVLFMKDLTFLASAGLRILIFAKQKMGADVGIYIIGSQGPVLETLKMSGFHHSVYLQDSYTE